LKKYLLLITFLKLSRYSDVGGEKKFCADWAADLKATETVRYRGNITRITVVIETT
jgi:hypothetical protein